MVKLNIDTKLTYDIECLILFDRHTMLIYVNFRIIWWSRFPDILFIWTLVWWIWNRNPSHFYKLHDEIRDVRRCCLAVFIRKTRHGVTMILRHKCDVAIRFFTAHLLAFVNVACMAQMCENASLFVAAKRMIRYDSLVSASCGFRFFDWHCKKTQLDRNLAA